MAIDHHPAIHDPSVQVRTDQPGHPCVIDAFLESVDQDVVIDPIKELGQVHVHHHALARLDVRPCGLDRIVRAPARSKPVAVFAEGGVDQRLQHLQQCLLDQSIYDRRNAQLTLAAVRFGNHHLAYRTGPVASRQQRLANVRPALAQQLGSLLNAEPVHPGCAFVGLDPLPRRLQVLSRQRRLQQATCACQLLCRPCIRVFMQRTSGFVAGSVWPGFTLPPSCPPGSLRHLTHDLVALHVLGYSLSFGPSLLPCGLSGPGSNYYDLC